VFLGDGKLFSLLNGCSAL